MTEVSTPRTMNNALNYIFINSVSGYVIRREEKFISPGNKPHSVQVFHLTSALTLQQRCFLQRIFFWRKFHVMKDESWLPPDQLFRFSCSWQNRFSERLLLQKTSSVTTTTLWI